MRYVTDRELGEIPALEGLSEEEVRSAMEDASRVYKHVRRNEWIEDDELRAYGERNDIDPDRMNMALMILRSQGRLFTLDTGPLPGGDGLEAADAQG